MKGAGFMGDFVARSEKALGAGCDLLLLCNEPDGVVQVLDRLKLSEKRPHVETRQARLRRLFKRKSLNWTDLERNEVYRKTSEKLTALQSEWLAHKA